MTAPRQFPKAGGVHYTPGDLARFLAELTVRQLDASRGLLRVLDPACGEGALLEAVALALPRGYRARVFLTGYEKDARATDRARRRLAAHAPQARLKTCDFLELNGVDGRQRAVGDGGGPSRFDAIIANPPYVRTQVLGAQEARRLARRFGLTGRVDLYHAFAMAMAHSLKPGGVLGLLTSNRFLSIKSGESLRALLRTEFEIHEVYDLGDTKLFAAAVLPAIVVARKRSDSANPESPPTFVRVYECEAADVDATPGPHLLDALRQPTLTGTLQTNERSYCIQRGTLSAATRETDVWTLSTPELAEWLSAVRTARAFRIGDIASVRVGIKTTADKVFVRDDWGTLDRAELPEKRLLIPLITHHEAARWVASAIPTRKVLYPHVMRRGKRTAIELDDYPHAKRYLTRHEERLRKRTYVTSSGRRWYEIWVPHLPADWRRHKIVFPDISSDLRFFYDDSGAVVQGDCYWITLHADRDPDWLFLILGVCNSTFITRYYDAVFHNKLYSGRRRFMTQYVREFPLPDLATKSARDIVQLTRQVVARGRATATQEAQLNDLVWAAFGCS